MYTFQWGPENYGRTMLTSEVLYYKIIQSYLLSTMIVLLPCVFTYLFFLDCDFWIVHSCLAASLFKGILCGQMRGHISPEICWAFLWLLGKPQLFCLGFFESGRYIWTLNPWVQSVITNSQVTFLPFNVDSKSRLPDFLFFFGQQACFLLYSSFTR